MRIKVSDPRAMLAAAGAVAALTLLAPFSTSSAARALPAAVRGVPAAAPPPDFTEVSAQGFGDRANSEAWSMEWWNGHLYVGTDRNFQCIKAAAAHLRNHNKPYPPVDRDVLCPGNPPTVPALMPSLGAQIWRLDSFTSPITQANWSQSYSEPATIPVTVGGKPALAPRDFGYRGMSVYTDVTGTQTLYMSGDSLKILLGPTATPPGLLGTTDGQHYAFVPSDPGTVMGDVNKTAYCCFRDQLSYKGTYYLAFAKLGGAGQVYTSTNPAAGDNAFVPYTPVPPATKVPMAVLQMAVFNGSLYLGAASPKGYEVWKAHEKCVPNPPPCRFYDFKKIVSNGAGMGAQGSTGVLSMQVFTDTTGTPYLYVGSDGAPTNKPAEIIRIHTDDTWDVVVGQSRPVSGTLKQPLSQLPGGFGWPYNVHMWSMAVYNGWLYVGTYDDSTAGFKNNKDLWPVMMPKMGFDLYATHDGATFTKVTDTGFFSNTTDITTGYNDIYGDMFSAGARTLKSTPLGLFVGTNNVYYGLRMWLGSLSPSRLAFTPTDLHEQRTGMQNIRLTWTAPTVPYSPTYTVYRSTLTQEQVPAYRMPVLDPGMDAVDGLPLSQAVTQTTVWVPGPDDVPLATTTYTHYVDLTVSVSTTNPQYTYYVVAQDPQGNLSEPSNSVDSASIAVNGGTSASSGSADSASPAVNGGTTFRTVQGALVAAMLRRQLTSTQFKSLSLLLWRARARLALGDVGGSQARLAALQACMTALAAKEPQASAPGRLAFLLRRLSARENLVQAHELDAAALL